MKCPFHIFPFFFPKSEINLRAERSSCLSNTKPPPPPKWSFYFIFLFKKKKRIFEVQLFYTREEEARRMRNGRESFFMGLSRPLVNWLFLFTPDELGLASSCLDKRKITVGWYETSSKITFFMN